MGAGIAAAIPIVIAPHNRGWHTEVEREYFSPKLTEFYDYNSEDRNYTIKHELLLENYQSFLAEFYDCIGESCKISNPPVLDSYVAFKEYFNKNKRNGGVPFIYEHWSMFSIVGGICPEYWLFYSGSYKAYLEVYSTLQHFEKILAKAMENPLANIAKFGIFG